MLKLSIIMGVPWLLDVFSAWANFDYGFEHGFVLRLCLDILNLFTVSINALKLVDRLDHKVFTGFYETQIAVSLSQSINESSDFVYRTQLQFHYQCSKQRVF